MQTPVDPNVKPHTFMDPQIQDTFQLLRKRKYRYVIYKPDDKCEFAVVDKCGLRDATWDHLKGDLPKHEGRWVVYDLEWQAEFGRKVSKVIFIAYSPDSNTNRS